MKRIFVFFDKLEDHIRAKLSRHPVLYSLIGGTALVLFWEGVSVIIGHVPFLNTLQGGFILVAVSLVVSLMIGIFVSFFVGDTIIMSGVAKEKKLAEREESELLAEAKMMSEIKREVGEIDAIVKELKTKADNDAEKRN